MTVCDRDVVEHSNINPAVHVLRLLREWGRIGSAGRLVSSRFASEQEAALAMAEHLKAKLSKGYKAV
jgi:predicted DNA-binding WGR domain protein